MADADLPALRFLSELPMPSYGGATISIVTWVGGGQTINLGARVEFDVQDPHEGATFTTSVGTMTAWQGWLDFEAARRLLENRLITGRAAPPANDNAPIVRRERLGGLLSSRRAVD